MNAGTVKAPTIRRGAKSRLRVFQDETEWLISLAPMKSGPRAVFKKPSAICLPRS